MGRHATRPLLNFETTRPYPPNLVMLLEGKSGDEHDDSSRDRGKGGCDIEENDAEDEGEHYRGGQSEAFGYVVRVLYDQRCQCTGRGAMQVSARSRGQSSGLDQRLGTHL